MKGGFIMKIHFIGIGGISMSALAEICLNKGYTVSGSDMSKSSMTDKLQEYAQLLINVGLNVQKDQYVVISSQVWAVLLADVMGEA